MSNAPIDPNENDIQVKATIEKTEEQRQRLNEAVKNVFVFKNLDPEARIEVIGVMFERRVLAGE